MSGFTVRIAFVSLAALLMGSAGGSGFWHWLVYNLPPTTTGLAAGAGAASGKALPAGNAQGRTDFGSPGYGGPCPPSGSGNHRYYFRPGGVQYQCQHAGDGADSRDFRALDLSTGA